MATATKTSTTRVTESLEAEGAAAAEVATTIPEAARSPEEGPTPAASEVAPMGSESPEGSSFQLATTRVRSTAPGPSAAVAEVKYCVRYEGNQSKKWDGREITLDGKWLESLYDVAELVPGKQLSLPWQAKGGRMEEWKAVLISATSTSPSGKECKNDLGCIW